MGAVTVWIHLCHDFSTSLKIVPIRDHFNSFLWNASSFIPYLGHRLNEGIRSWAMYEWAPLAIIGEEVHRLKEDSIAQNYSRVNTDDQELTDLQTSSARLSPTSTNNIKDKGDDRTLPPTGIIIGVWNISATIPQFIASFIAMIAFSILEPGKSPELAGVSGLKPSQDSIKKRFHGLSGTAACLAIGAVCSLIAGLRTMRLRKFEG